MNDKTRARTANTYFVTILVYQIAHVRNTSATRRCPIFHVQSSFLFPPHSFFLFLLLTHCFTDVLLVTWFFFFIYVLQKLFKSTTRTILFDKKHDDQIRCLFYDGNWYERMCKIIEILERGVKSFHNCHSRLSSLRRLSANHVFRLRSTKVG